MEINKQEKVIDPIYAENTQMCNVYKQITLDLKNSCIPFELIEDHWKEYQLFLEKIADYLADASFWSENEFGVEFFDVSPVKTQKTIASFQVIHNQKRNGRCFAYLDECLHSKCL